MFLLFKHADETGDEVKILAHESDLGDLRIQATTRDGDPLVRVDVPADLGRLLMIQLQTLYEEPNLPSLDQDPVAIRLSIVDPPTAG